MNVGEFEIGGASALKSLQSLDKGFGDFVGKLGKFSAVFAGSFAAFEGVAMVMEKFKETLDLGGSLQDLSTQTGEAVGDLVILRQAFENAGLGADNAGEFLLRLQDSISGVNEAGKSTAGSLKTLGLSAKELRDLPALGQIEKLSEGFKKLDQTTRVQVAKDLFGKSGGKALALFGDDEALTQARQQAGPLADIMDKNVGTFDKLGDVINGLKLNVQEFFAGALSKIAPEATNIAEALSSIDFVGIGETVGILAGMVLKLGEAFVAIAPAVNTVSETLSKLFGSGSTATAGLADKYRGFAKLNRPEDKNADDKSPVSALQKVGLGGNFGGGGDPLLSENQRQTTELKAIRAHLASMSNNSTKTSPPSV